MVRYFLFQRRWLRPSAQPREVWKTHSYNYLYRHQANGIAAKQHVYNMFADDSQDAMQLRANLLSGPRMHVHLRLRTSSSVERWHKILPNLLPILISSSYGSKRQYFISHTHIPRLNVMSFSSKLRNELIIPISSPYHLVIGRSYRESYES